MAPRTTVFVPWLAGEGTPMGERFTSAVARWATTGTWREPGHAAVLVLAPLLKRTRIDPGNDTDRRRFFGRMFSKGQASFNAVGHHASTFVSAVAVATGTDLSAGTFLALRRVIDRRRLMHRGAPACPDCLTQQRAAADDAQLLHPVYEPLLWALADVTWCQRHTRSLESRCPGCGEICPVFSYRYRPGHCGLCGAWRGVAAGPRHRLSEPEVAWQGFVAEQLGRLVAALPALGLIDGAALPGTIADIARGVGGQNELGRRVGRSKGTVSGWVNGTGRPDMQALLRLSAVGGRDVVDLIQGAESAGQKLPATLVPIASERHEPVDWEKVRLALRGAMTIDPAPALYALLAYLGVDRGDAVERYPEECAAVHRLYLDSLPQRRRDGAEVRARAAEAFVSHAARVGAPVSRREVEAGTGLRIRRPEVTDRWRAAKARCGRR